MNDALAPKPRNRDDQPILFSNTTATKFFYAPSNSALGHRIAGGALGQALGTLETGGLGSGIAVSLDDKRIASTGWETVTVHDVATGQKMFQFSIGTPHVALARIAY